MIAFAVKVGKRDKILIVDCEETASQLKALGWELSEPHDLGLACTAEPIHGWKETASEKQPEIIHGERLLRVCGHYVEEHKHGVILVSQQDALQKGNGNEH